MTSVVALRPTRGLEFTESSMALENALAYAYLHHMIDCTLPSLRCGDKPIPDSFNSLVEVFLTMSAQYAWFVEEDIVVPTNALIELLNLNVDVAAINYNLKEGGPNRNSEIRTDDGELHTLGTGCMLINRRVFEGLPSPWFRTDLIPGMRHPGSSTPKPFLDLIPNRCEYGGHDGFFTLSAIRAGFTVATVPELRCEHLRLDAMGAAGVNDGCHQISRVD